MVKVVRPDAIEAPAPWTPGDDRRQVAWVFGDEMHPAIGDRLADQAASSARKCLGLSSTNR